jgi:hypothetical protein
LGGDVVDVDGLLCIMPYQCEMYIVTFATPQAVVFGAGFGDGVGSGAGGLDPGISQFSVAFTCQHCCMERVVPSRASALGRVSAVRQQLFDNAASQTCDLSSTIASLNPCCTVHSAFGSVQLVAEMLLPARVVCGARH